MFVNEGQAQQMDPIRPQSVDLSEAGKLVPGVDERLRRNIIFGASGVATVLSVTFWLIGAAKDVDSIERLVIPLLALGFGAITLLSWRGNVRGAQLGLLAVGGGILLERIHFVLDQPKPGYLPLLDAYELLIWFPCLYVVSFLLLEQRSALLFNLTILGSSLIVVRDWLVPGDDGNYHADLTEFYIGQLGCVIVVYAFAILKERLLSTQRLALDLRAFAETDFLTGVPNRRLLTDGLKREIACCERAASELSVVLLDLDHFKRINDTFGHDEGDRALRRVAMLADRNRRQTDTFGRWGGEEFLLVAPGLDLDGGRMAAERLRELIEDSAGESRVRVTASLGVSEFRTGDDVGSLVKRADEALFEAKLSGRNRVVISKD